MSIRMKLISLVGAFVLVLGLVITGVLAASSQTITMNGSVNFNVTDKSLWVKEVRMQESGSDPVVVSNFTPGYINGDFNFNVGNFENNHGSFALYFDIINTTTDSYIVTADYSELSSSVSGVEVYITNMITANSETITEITSTTEVTTTLELQVINPNLAEIDLSMITINIYNGVLAELEYSFSDSEARITNCLNKDIAEIAIIPATIINELDGKTYPVTETASMSLYNCKNLKYFITENGSNLKKIGDFTFMACENLTNIDIPDGVESIGYMAFQECYSVISIELPKTILSIGDMAFQNCTNLISITSFASIPPTLNSATLSIVPKLTNIYVPAESVGAYKTASVWSSYADIITAIA